MTPPGGLAILLAALAGGIGAVERKAVVQAMVSRPIVLGPLIGAALGDPLGGLFVAAPLELLWSGTANLGAALPQHETVATAAIVAAAVGAGQLTGHVDGAEACLAFAVLAPLALLGRRLEGFGEQTNDLIAARAAARVERGEPEAGLRLHLLGLINPFLATALATGVAAAFLAPALARAVELLPPVAVRGLGLGWALVWAAGGACAVRAARLPRGAALAVGAAAAAAALWAVTAGLSGRGG